jgi:type II secretory pathway predicted ATPase ExeA
MIKSTFGITQEPFHRNKPALLSQQKQIVEIIQIHAQHGGFSVIIGHPGVGKTVLREHIEQLGNARDSVVVSFSSTRQAYQNVLNQLAESFKIYAPIRQLEKELISTAYRHIRDNKVLYTLIDEAHLLDMPVLRKLRLLFDRFPKKHNLVLLGQPDLLYRLSMNINEDIKSRITYSQNILPLNDDDLAAYIVRELEAVRLGLNVFDQAAVEVIVRSASGNLRLCRNLCYASLVEACRDNKKIVSISHVNNILVQPHWRSHEELIKQQVA